MVAIQMNILEDTVNSLYVKTSICQTKGIKDDIITIERMHEDLSKYYADLTEDKKRRINRSLDKYRSAIDTLENKCMCSPLIIR